MARVKHVMRIVFWRKLAMWARAIVDAPSDVVPRKRKITPDRLIRAGALAAERARKRVSAALKCDEEAVSVDCTYQGPENRRRRGTYTA